MSSQKKKLKNSKSNPEKADDVRKTWTSTLFLMLLIVLAYDIYAIAFGEKIPVHDGLGWDGQLYGNVIQNFEDLVYNKQLMEFTIGRTLPLSIIYYSMKWFHIELTNENMLLQFQIYNSIVILFSVFLWIKIANHLRLSVTKMWIGFFALFVNFAMLKNQIYYSASTDPTTFLFGCLLLLFFLKKNSWGILFITILGAFVQPTMIYFGLLLFIFQSKKIEPQIPKFKANYIVSGLICIMVLYGIIKSNWINNFTLPYDAVEPIQFLVPLSILFLLTVLFILLSELFNNKKVLDFSEVKTSLMIDKLVIAILVFLAIQFIYKNSGKPNIEAYHLSFYLLTILKSSISKPFINIISFVIWFGPLILITMINWKNFVLEVNRYGLGLLFMLTLGFLLLFIDSESRHTILIYPFICGLTVKSIDEKKTGKYFLFLFAATSILFSKIWFSFNPLPSDPGNLWEFPMQKYFMNSGPWMSNQMYAIQGGFVLITFIMMFLFLNRKNLQDNKLSIS